MPTFVTLSNFTEQGVKNVKDSVKRADAGRYTAPGGASSNTPARLPTDSKVSGPDATVAVPASTTMQVSRPGSPPESCCPGSSTYAPNPTCRHPADSGVTLATQPRASGSRRLTTSELMRPRGPPRGPASR